MRTLFFLLLPCWLYAHPGVGIVRDSKGNIYYTDLKQVWMLSPEGRRTIAVPGVHTHELFMDGNDRLFGEHLWYNGEQVNTWGSYAWCLHPGGRLDTVIAPHTGFLEHYSFQRDRGGNMYWFERGKTSRLFKKPVRGKERILFEGQFRDIRWMHVTPKGTVFFIDLLDLYRYDEKRGLQLLVKKLANAPGPLSLRNARHSIFGLWTDSLENVYAAVYSSKTVKKITPDGRVSDFAHSYGTWSPVGGIFDPAGRLWLLESSLTNDTRVRIIPPAKSSGQHIPLLFGIIAIGPLVWLLLGGYRLLRQAHS